MNRKTVTADFKKAINNLEDAMNTPAETDLLKAGCIQYFEFCFEFAWKSIKAVAGEHGILDCNSPKICLKHAFANSWIENEELWLDMLDSRNRMPHTYDADYAFEVYSSISSYLPEFKKLLSNLEKAD
ncbi:MAG: HI0074 family nucleotidyltransferase substrate-binding subunit [bacterium]